MSKLLRIGVFLALALVSFTGWASAEAVPTTTIVTTASNTTKAAAVTVWLQVMDSCKQGLPGAKFTLVAPDGTSSGPQTSAGTKRVTVSSGTCPLQRGNCQRVPTGCVSWAITPPGTGTDLYEIRENSTFNSQDGFDENPAGKTPFSGFVPCNGGSACGSESATFAIDSAGVVAGATTNVFPDGHSVVYPSSGHALGTQADPIVFHNFQLGDGSCDGDDDADDHLTGSPGAHCNSDEDTTALRSKR